ncbi:CHAD domain-containing protein [Rhodospirillaceae bacterium KN72]|uniref:CHAD domain-containing protein n=1 Tax=Pacificispira spongiicola TaxID=2729598 RepID=A0A7Y0E481_9PROT|nr:CYTH and CHAD domain-containing protein [Pacificispira spongiicola]NMM46126.1 CHAD domain-containing protein [Pacificispira spongiicola]
MAEKEIELKLTIRPEDVVRFRREPVLHACKRGRARSKQLLAVYFDTKALVLRKKRVALRIRQEGAQRIQTVKASLGGAGLLRRLEHNAPITGDTPDLSLIADTEARSEIAGIIGRKKLQPVFTTDIRRTIWLIDHDGSTIEVALDLGKIISNGNSVDVCEVELELKGGPSLGLLNFACELAQRYRLRVSEESKAVRGYGLFEGVTPKPRKAKPPVLNPDADAWTSFARIVEEGSAQLFGNEAAVLDGTDIEGVHQARVAVRRLRAALSAFSGVVPDDIRKPAGKELRWVQNALGPARDWDVFITETLEPLVTKKGAPSAFEKFLHRAERARHLAYRRAHKIVRGARYGRLQIRLIRMPYLPEPESVRGLTTRDVATRLLQERYDTVLEAAGESPAQLAETYLHMLRIDIKKLRYAIEFFDSIYDQESAKEWLSATKRLQDCLGGLNDAVVHADMIDAMEAPDMPVPKSVRAFITAHNNAKIESGLMDLQDAWIGFAALPVYWR